MCFSRFEHWVSLCNQPRGSGIKGRKVPVDDRCLNWTSFTFMHRGRNCIVVLQMMNSLWILWVCAVEPFNTRPPWSWWTYVRWIIRKSLVGIIFHISLWTRINICNSKHLCGKYLSPEADSYFTHWRFAFEIYRQLVELDVPRAMPMIWFSSIFLKS